MKRAWRLGLAALALSGIAGAGLSNRFCRGSAPAQEGPVDALARALADGGLSRLESQGRRLFLASCATCHGPSGRGDGQNAFLLAPPPPDFATSLGRLTRDERRGIVEHGSASLGRSPLCPPRGSSISLEDTEALLAYLDLLARQGPPPEPPRRKRRR